MAINLQLGSVIARQTATNFNQIFIFYEKHFS